MYTYRFLQDGQKFIQYKECNKCWVKEFYVRGIKSVSSTRFVHRIANNKRSSAFVLVVRHWVHSVSSFTHVNEPYGT